MVRAYAEDRQTGFRDLAGRRVTVMGLGHFGGGAGVARWLVDQGARVLITDRKPRSAVAAGLAQLDELVRAEAVELRLGEHDVGDFVDADLVVANPAVPKPWQNCYLQETLAAGVPITTEIGLLVERLDRRRVIGVTGTAGKSTTAAMIHHVLARTGRAHLGGNIGGSLLGQVADIEADEHVVLELSSAMLYWLDRTCWSPAAGVLTNLEPNHLDWHETFEHYRDSKETIFRHQRPGDLGFRGADHGHDGRPVELRVPGAHNRDNASLAATVAAEVTGLDRDDALRRLADFPGLPHRLQLVAERGAQRFFNDSKCTTPAATCLAVDAFEDARRVHLIAGGHDKGSDLTPIAQLAERLAGLYTIGTTGRRLAADAASFGPALPCVTLERAVTQALERMGLEDVLLLSPGCASWDQFTNYEMRGLAFCELIRSPAR